MSNEIEKTENNNLANNTNEILPIVSQAQTPAIVRRKVRGLTNEKLYALTFSDEFKSMSKYVKGGGFDSVMATIELYLIELDVAMNLSRRLNEHATKLIAEDVYDILYTCSFEELSRFFKEFRSGLHGKIFQGINSENVCEAARNYMNHRQMYFANRSENESNLQKVRRTREENGENLTIEEIKERVNARFNAK